MIRILDDTKALTTLASDSTNGIGVIQNIKGTVTEELNGSYEAEFTVATSEKYFGSLHVGGIVRIETASGSQMFRIYKITKPINQICTVYCEHISYDLTKVAVLPFTATGASAACDGMEANASANEFTMYTDISNSSSSFKLTRPRTFRECLGGCEGSMLDVFRGEYEWDNLAVKMLAHRGADNGVRISYGKNLTDLKQEENNASVYTAVLGYAIVNEVEYHGDIYEKVASTNPRVKIVDFSSYYDMNTEPTAQDLTNKATSYANANNIEVPKVSIDVSFVLLHQTEEYKNIAPLERVSLGDTVHVYFERMGVEASSKVIKTVWNINTQKYDSVSLGDTKSSLNSLINDAIQQTNENVTRATSFIESELNQMASLIINGLGLHRTLVPVAGGGYQIYLHNKETLALSDTQYIFTANGFMVSTDYGQTWNAGFDASGNAVLNSLATITLRALEIYGSRITFGDENDKYITAGVYTDSNDNAVGVSFDGTGYARFQPKQMFQVLNRDTNESILNKVEAARSSAESYIDITNGQYTNTIANFLRPANSLQLRSDASYNVTTLDVYRLINFQQAARLMLQSTDKQSIVTLEALQYISDSSYANGAGIEFSSGFGTQNDKYNRATISVRAADTTTIASQLKMEQDGTTTLKTDSLLINSLTQFANASGTSSSVTCSANNSGSTTVSVTIPTGYKAIAVANVKSNGDVVPAYTSAGVFGMKGSQTLNVWWHNGTNSAKTCTFTVDLLCAVDV